MPGARGGARRRGVARATHIWGPEGGKAPPPQESGKGRVWPAAKSDGRPASHHVRVQLLVGDALDEQLRVGRQLLQVLVLVLQQLEEPRREQRFLFGLGGEGMEELCLGWMLGCKIFGVLHGQQRKPLLKYTLDPPAAHPRLTTLLNKKNKNENRK